MATRHVVISLFLQEKSAILRKSRTKEGLLNPDRRRTHYLLGLIAARRLLAVKRAVWVKSSHKDVCEAINIYPPHMAQEINWIFPRERRMDTAIICCTTLTVPNPPPPRRLQFLYVTYFLSCCADNISRKFNYTKYGRSVLRYNISGVNQRMFWLSHLIVFITNAQVGQIRWPIKFSGAYSDQSYTT